MREVIGRLGACEEFEFGLLRGTAYPDDEVFVLGRYEGAAFDGTDTLSMAVMPDAKEFLNAVTAERPRWTVLFEGDRLFSESFFEHAIDLEFYISGFTLVVDEHELERRHRERADTQDETWLQGRRTKVRNVTERFGFEEIPNETEVERRYVADRVCEAI